MGRGNTAQQSKKTPTPQQAVSQASATGPTRFGGIIQEDFLPELRWPQAYQTYDEMRKNSPAIGGFFRAIDAGFRAVRWESTPYDDSPEAKTASNFLHSCINDMERPLTSQFTDINTMLPFGFAPTEMVFKWRRGRDTYPASKYTDNLIGFHDWPLIPQDTIQEWLYEDEKYPSRLTGIRQQVVQQGKPPIVDIPINKIMLFRAYAEKDSPEGLSILRNAYRSWYFLTNLEVVEAISLERTGAGIPTIKLPERASSKTDQATGSDEEAAQNIVKQIKADEQGGVVLPYGWEFSIVTSSLQRPELFDLAIKRHRSNILMSLLAVFLELGTARVGSFAMAREGTSFFEHAFDGIVMSVEDLINEKAVPMLFTLNGFSLDRLPRLTHRTKAGESLKDIIESVEKMITAEVLQANDPNLVDYVKAVFKIPTGDTVAEREKLTRPEETDAADADEQDVDSETGPDGDADTGRDLSRVSQVPTNGTGREVGVP